MGDINQSMMSRTTIFALLSLAAFASASTMTATMTFYTDAKCAKVVKDCSADAMCKAYATICKTRTKADIDNKGTGKCVANGNTKAPQYTTTMTSSKGTCSSGMAKVKATNNVCKATGAGGSSKTSYSCSGAATMTMS